MAVALAALGACGERPRAAVPAAPAPTLPERSRPRREPTAEEWFYEPVDPGASSRGVALRLPVGEGSVVRLEGGARVWDRLGASGRELVVRSGVAASPAIVDAPARVRLGAFYEDLRERRIPYVVTVDALYAFLRIGIERALAEVEHAVLAPALSDLLARLGARLGAEQRGASVELAPALRLARGVVEVAAVLATPDATPSPDLAAVVQQELARIEAHAGREPSPLLVVPIDYARFAAPSGATLPGAYLAMTWLGAAPLALVGRSEVPGAPVDVAEARTHARAALSIARLVERDVDPDVHGAYTRIARLLSFVWGPPDDVSPTALGDLAHSARIELAAADRLADVVVVDRLRRRAAARSPSVYDGSGAPRGAGASVRIFGGHAPADSVAIQALGARGLPSTLDLSSWLGADAEPRGGEREWQVAAALAFRPLEDAPARRSSLHASSLDALLAWGESTVVRAAPPAERCRAESVLAAWTLLRHGGRPFARARGRKPEASVRVSGAQLPAFVEPEPDVIARLVAVARQARRGLAALAPASAGFTDPILAEVEDVISGALRVAAKEIEDEGLTPEDAAALASTPARVAALEGEPGSATASVVTRVSDVFGDPVSGKALVSATGAVEPLAMLVREPGTARIVLAVGAHLTHHEMVEPAGRRSTDASWLARVRAGDVPARGAYVSAFRVAASERPAP